MGERGDRNIFIMFEQELRKFRQATIYLDSFLSQIQGFNNMQRAKVGASAHDIVIAALLFKRAFDEAYQYWIQEEGKEAAIPKDSIDQELAPTPLKYLEASVKALLFPVRSFQDNIYGIFLYLHGSSVRKDSTMKKCLKTINSPICNLIDHKLLKYREWFFEMRRIRNRVKNGNSFSFGLKNQRFGIIINDLDGARSALEASLDRIISVDTFVEAFKRSAEISDLAFTYAKDCNVLQKGETIS